MDCLRRPGDGLSEGSDKSCSLADSFSIIYQTVVVLQTMFAMEKGLGGVMFWTIDTDDFRGNCYNISYPLISTSKNVINDFGRAFKI